LIDAMAARPLIPDADLDATSTPASFDPMPAETGTGVNGAPPFREERAGATDFTRPESKAERAPRPSGHPMATSLLGRRISEYLTLARADAQRRQAMERRDAAASRTDAVPPPPALPPRRFAWPEHLSEGALDTLQRFEAANARMPVQIDRARTLSPTADAPHASKPWRTDDDAAHGHDSIRDLSVQMAEVLRTQALRHGIDLT